MNKADIITQMNKIKSFRPKKNALPFLFTFANACLGFLSIIQAVEKNYTMAVYCLLLAALMDACDGRLARALGTESALGGELDSLADAISFCLAPCILLYAWFPGTVGYSGMIALGAYLCAGMFRLAKFNLINNPQQTDFIGLPTPIAAFFVTSLVLYHQWIATHPLRFMLYKRVPFILIASIALLMVSSIPFPSFKKAQRQRKLKHTIVVSLLWSCALIALACGYPLIFIASTLYIVISVVHWLYIKK